MSAPVAEDRDGTVVDADGTDMCYNLHVVLTKHVKRSVEWEEHIEQRGIRGGVRRLKG